MFTLSTIHSNFIDRYRAAMDGSEQVMHSTQQHTYAQQIHSWGSDRRLTSIIYGYACFYSYGVSLSLGPVLITAYYPWHDNANTRSGPNQPSPTTTSHSIFPVKTQLWVFGFSKLRWFFLYPNYCCLTFGWGDRLDQSTTCQWRIPTTSSQGNVNTG